MGINHFGNEMYGDTTHTAGWLWRESAYNLSIDLYVCCYFFSLHFLSLHVNAGWLGFVWILRSAASVYASRCDSAEIDRHVSFPILIVSACLHSGCDDVAA